MTAGTRFAINMVGAVGILFGVLPIVKYLLGFDALSLTTKPYDWLGLSGGVRALPPLMVLAICGVLAWWLERRAQEK